MKRKGECLCSERQLRPQEGHFGRTARKVSAIMSVPVRKAELYASSLMLFFTPLGANAGPQSQPKSDAAFLMKLKKGKPLEYCA